MWRFLHLVGWLIALGLAGWVTGFVVGIVLDSVFEGGRSLGGAFVGPGAGIGFFAGLFFALVTWSLRAWDRPLIFVGALLVALGVVSGAFLFLAAAAEGRARPDTQFAGRDLLLLGMLAFVCAAIGAGLALAGIAAKFGRQPPTPIGSSH